MHDVLILVLFLARQIVRIQYDYPMISHIPFLLNYSDNNILNNNA